MPNCTQHFRVYLLRTGRTGTYPQSAECCQPRFHQQRCEDVWQRQRSRTRHGGKRLHRGYAGRGHRTHGGPRENARRGMEWQRWSHRLCALPRTGITCEQGISFWHDTGTPRTEREKSCYIFSGDLKEASLEGKGDMEGLRQYRYGQ